MVKCRPLDGGINFTTTKKEDEERTELTTDKVRNSFEDKFRSFLQQLIVGGGEEWSNDAQILGSWGIG